MSRGSAPAFGESGERWIAHVDMDAFFVGVELLRRPNLRGKPVIVGTSTDPRSRGVVMAASYEARKFGVRSAVPLSVAHRRCPQAVLLPRDMAHYREVSGDVMAVVRRHSPRIEVAGLDEAYLDLSDEPLPKTVCRRIKHDVRTETGLTCSIGLAQSKLVAKVASDLDKPNGFCMLRPGDWLPAVGGRPVSLLPGVGPKTDERLAGLGIRTIAELAGSATELLERSFGPRQAAELHRRASGIDASPVVTGRERKSESRETTFPADVDDREVLLETATRLATDVCAGLREGGYRGRTVTLKVRLRPFRTYTRSRTIEAPTDDGALVGRVARELLDTVELDAPVRLVGVGVASLSRTADSARRADPGSAESLHLGGL
jgi:DNA polymerase IV